MSNETMRFFFPLKIISYPQYDCSEDALEDIPPREAVTYEDQILAAVNAGMFLTQKPVKKVYFLT